MKLTKPGELRSFAAYLRCSADLWRDPSEGALMHDLVSLEGPVELIDGGLAVRIPLAAGGDKLAPLAREIGTTDHEYLTVLIQPWLAEKLRIDVGSLVVVDNYEGRFRITRSAANDDTNE